ISGSKSSRAALFSKPTSSSNSVANTEEVPLTAIQGTSSEGPEASFRCCK
uniref:Uncharacterized protein n=1 Tax=Anas platyrhynchos platyrhynchos TaxID=8840 RepID=A0A493TQ55_ANAPP